MNVYTKYLLAAPLCAALLAPVLHAGARDSTDKSADSSFKQARTVLPQGARPHEPERIEAGQPSADAREEPPSANESMDDGINELLVKDYLHHEYRRLGQSCCESPTE